MYRLARLTLATALSLACGSLLAQAQSANRPAAQPTKVAKAPSTPASRVVAQIEAAPAQSVALTAAQLEMASRVYAGRSDCEFNQHVTIAPVEGRPGYFQVRFKQSSYVMVPQETSTGAVRLEDRQAGVMWLQIASKSMLMDSKAGRRMADACMHDEQRAFAGAPQAPTGPSLLGGR